MARTWGPITHPLLHMKYRASLTFSPSSDAWECRPLCLPARDLEGRLDNKLALRRALDDAVTEGISSHALLYAAHRPLSLF